MTLLFFKRFYFPSNNFAFLQRFLLSYSFFSLSFKCVCFPSILIQIFFAFLQKLFIAFLQIFFIAFLQIFFIAFLQIFFCFPAFFFLLPFKNFCFPSNIFAFLQILLLSFKAFSLLSFFFKKIGMTKFIS